MIQKPHPRANQSNSIHISTWVNISKYFHNEETHKALKSHQFCKQTSPRSYELCVQALAPGVNAMTLWRAPSMDKFFMNAWAGTP